MDALLALLLLASPVAQAAEPTAVHLEAPARGRGATRMRRLLLDAAVESRRRGYNWFLLESPGGAKGGVRVRFLTEEEASRHGPEKWNVDEVLAVGEDLAG